MAVRTSGAGSILSLCDLSTRKPRDVDQTGTFGASIAMVQAEILLESPTTPQQVHKGNKDSSRRMIRDSGSATSEGKGEMSNFVYQSCRLVRMQSYAQRINNAQDLAEGWTRIGPEQAAEPIWRQAGTLRDRVQALCAGDGFQRPNNEAGVGAGLFEAGVDVFIGLEILSRVPGGELFSHGCVFSHSLAIRVPDSMSFA
jgi:hypothetical protein